MALISPGVQVSVIDESFYTNAEPGTRPLIIVTTASNKQNSSGTGTAAGTTSAYNGKVWTITSQRELAETFGDPVFKVDTSGNPINAGELNEYGLQAAYSFLGVSNSALVVRADLDLNELLPKADAPGGAPEDGTFWLDTANSSWGIFEWDGRTALAGGQNFTNKVPAVVVENGIANAPASAAGSYAVVAGTTGTESEVSIYYRSLYSTNGKTATPSWVKVGSNEWVTAFPTISQTTSTSTGLSNTTTLSIDSTTINLTGTTLTSLVSDINGANGAFGARINGAGKLEIFTVSATKSSLTITEVVNVSPAGTAILPQLGIASGTFNAPALAISKHTEVPQFKTAGANRPSGSVWIKTTEPNAGARWRVKKYNGATKLWEQLTAPIYANDTAATTALDPIGNGANIVVNTVYVDYDATPVATFKVYRRSNSTTWSAMPVGTMYFISGVAPTTLTADGKLWYSSVTDEVDILVNGAPGQGWKGYKSIFTGSNATGPIVSPTKPTSQTDVGASALVDGDLWVDTSDLEHYPLLKRWNNSFKRWDLVDVSDQTTEAGILFADARWSTAGANSTPATIASLLSSNYVDFDAPDPALYPQGMLLWNTRRSGFNVKKFVRNHVNLAADNTRLSGSPSQSGYYPHRWVTESGNQTDGSGSFGRHAQRKVIVQSLQALVNINEEIRDTERNSFNLLAAPGYPELIGELNSLNSDRGLTAFVVGDSPARLNASATSLNNWATNAMGSAEDDDKGLVSTSEYMGVFYPWGYTSDNFGRNVVVPPSHMMLRTLALNDQIAYPWFAPAGTRRGNITNATSVGFVTPEGEFKSVALNDGQRDTLYTNNVNPITYFTGAGLVNFGQKTRAKGASALDRINVARLVIFLRNQLNKLAKPYIFEPNDKITRDEIKQQVESLLLELVGQRALYDFLVVCDESNNTPNRIDRNELHVDIAIEPVKAVEFIYIPIRLKNTGEIAGLGKK
jgi:hypothetical protein